MIDARVVPSLHSTEGQLAVPRGTRELSLIIHLSEGDFVFTGRCKALVVRTPGSLYRRGSGGHWEYTLQLKSTKASLSLENVLLVRKGLNAKFTASPLLLTTSQGSLKVTGRSQGAKSRIKKL